MATDGDRHEREIRWAKISAVIGALAVAIGFLAWQLPKGSEPQPEPNPVGPSPTATVDQPSEGPSGESETASPKEPNDSPSEGASVVPTTEYLADLEPVAFDFMENGAADVNGASFPQSLIMPSHGWLTVNKVSYNAARTMKKFRATIGLRDDSPPTSPILFEVIADGHKVYSKSLYLGSSRKLDLNIKDVLRLDLILRFPAAEKDSQTSYYGVWGDAQFVR